MQTSGHSTDHNATRLWRHSRSHSVYPHPKQLSLLLADMWHCYSLWPRSCKHERSKCHYSTPHVGQIIIQHVPDLGLIWADTMWVKPFLIPVVQTCQKAAYRYPKDLIKLSLFFVIIIYLESPENCTVVLLRLRNNLQPI